MDELLALNPQIINPDKIWAGREINLPHDTKFGDSKVPTGSSNDNKQNTGNSESAKSDGYAYSWGKKFYDYWFSNNANVNDKQTSENNAQENSKSNTNDYSQAGGYCSVEGANDNGKETRWDLEGSKLYPSCIICDCCGSESGYYDITIESIRSNRKAWLEAGAQWRYPKSKPEGWNLEEQLAKIPEEYR